ncbi:hypothetical protein [Pseudomonas alabamensis]|uniref:hypothetical protein n=1 Tax=Pseudomonas alabamensis TaxID=3064349 RepID=UPI0021DACA90|nr:hypothetical protein [Pseudomonas entomophila]
METLQLALLSLSGITLLVLVLVHSRMGEVWDVVRNDRDLQRISRIHEHENNELRSELRAERELVGQLRRQVQMLLGVAPES